MQCIAYRKKHSSRYPLYAICCALIITFLSIGLISKKNLTNIEKTLLTRLIFHEASGIDINQKTREAIAWVIYNRMNSAQFGNSVSRVIFEKNQFSGVSPDEVWTKENKIQKNKWERSLIYKNLNIREKREYARAYKAVLTVFTKKRRDKDPTQGSVFFHSPQSREYTDNECNRKDLSLKAPGWLCEKLQKGTLEEISVDGIEPHIFRFYRLR